jgi:signal recognition particle subunit SRP54
MGEGVADINLAAQPPAVILMAGLQGAGKTTTTAKLART